MLRILFINEYYNLPLESKSIIILNMYVNRHELQIMHFASISITVMLINIADIHIQIQQNI